MSDVFPALMRLFLNFEVIPEDTPAGVLVFVAACAIVGAFAVILDALLFFLRGRSLLGLRHGPARSVVLLLAWALGAAMMGYVGQILEMFKVSIAATMTVGFGWPALFTAVLKRFHEEIEEETDGIQQVGGYEP